MRPDRPGACGMKKRLFSEAIVEFRPAGRYVKVTAMDPDSLVEAVVVGAASASREELKELALNKLDWLLERRRSGTTGKG
jgi:hypothetical protein